MLVSHLVGNNEHGACPKPGDSVYREIVEGKGIKKLPILRATKNRGGSDGSVLDTGVIPASVVALLFVRESRATSEQSSEAEATS